MKLAFLWIIVLFPSDNVPLFNYILATFLTLFIIISELREDYSVVGRVELQPVPDYYPVE